MKFQSIIFATTLCLLPHQGIANVLELTQAQLRQLVVEGQILDAETVVTGAAHNFGGVVMDIRGFLSEGKMTYRLLLQRNDGQIVEVLVNGVDGQQVSHNTPMGQIVSEVAKEMNGNRGNSANANRGNANDNGNRGNGRDNSNRGNGRDNSNRGNGRDNSDRGNNGNGNGRNK